MTENNRILNQLDFMAQMVPAPFYWMDIEGRFIGLNNLVVQGLGGENKEAILGKTVFEVYPDKEIATSLQEDIDNVIKTAKSSSREDTIIDMTTGKLRYYIATRSPIFNSKGEVIAVVGTSIEITAEKEAEKLRFENEENRIEMEMHRIAGEEQAKFRKIVGQMAHDIQSPLVSLQSIVNTTTSMAESERVTLRTATMNITDITNHVLGKYRGEIDVEEEKAEPILVSASLLQILSEKRYEYKHTNIEFKDDFDLNAKFSFIKVDCSNFKRAISNLINNAVDALLISEVAKPKITLTLYINNEWTMIGVEDNGIGMPKEMIDKIENGVSFTEGKVKGNGLGLAQVWETMRKSIGRLRVNSYKNMGSTIILLFPKIIEPGWIATEIKIFKNDIVIILDDESSIHGAWDTYLAQTVQNMPEVQIKHFTYAVDAIDFINKQDSERVLLLTDYELLNQNINGLQVIEKVNTKKSILVTSHFDNREIRKQAMAINVQVLPKGLVSEVTIKQDKKLVPNSKIVDMVLLDDDRMFIEQLTNNYYSNLAVDIYCNPRMFLDEVMQYPLNTKIFVDNQYDNYDPNYNLSGVQIAQLLYEKGYMRLYLLSGEKPHNIPEYLTTILKSDLEKLYNLDKI